MPNTMVGRQPPAESIDSAAFLNMRYLIVALIVTLVGCATPEPTAIQTPEIRVSESTWWAIDEDIDAAALAATGPARNCARGYMGSWVSLVRQRSESDFIPWYTSYWTQQWLAIKVGWYTLSGGEGEDLAKKRLTSYLQEQYLERVLDPVAEEINPEVVRENVLTLYIRLLGEQLQEIRRYYGVPQDQFDRRLEAISSIAQDPPAAHSASLYQLVHAHPISSLPAYAALIARSREAADGAGPRPSGDSLLPVAEQAAETLVAKLALSGGAGVAAAAVGGVAGLAISLGAAGFGAIAHESERPAMEAQLREDLNSALDAMWHSLMDDPVTGVMAGVYRIQVQIGRSLIEAHAQALESESAQ